MQINWALKYFSSRCGDSGCRLASRQTHSESDHCLSLYPCQAHLRPASNCARPKPKPLQAQCRKDNFKLPKYNLQRPLCLHRVRRHKSNSKSVPNVLVLPAKDYLMRLAGSFMVCTFKCIVLYASHFWIFSGQVSRENYHDFITRESWRRKLQMESQNAMQVIPDEKEEKIILESVPLNSFF